MDTGSYMENQMSDQIEASEHFFQEFLEHLDKRIELFIKENNYDWTAQSIVTEYREKYSKGYYVSFTCEKVIEHFLEDLEHATGTKRNRKRL